MKQINGNMSKSLKNTKVKNKQASAKNQLNLNIKKRKVEGIKKTKQIPENKITKKQKMSVIAQIKLKYFQFHCYAIFHSNV